MIGRFGAGVAGVVRRASRRWDRIVRAIAVIPCCAGIGRKHVTKAGNIVPERPLGHKLYVQTPVAKSPANPDIIEPNASGGMKDGRDDRNNGNGGTGPGTGVVTKTRPKTKKPSLYKVLLLNDDYTPMEFVVHILERIFNKTREEAVQVMLHVHRHGVGVCGVFTFEVAETKVAQVIEFARRHEHPLQCTMEKE